MGSSGKTAHGGDPRLQLVVRGPTQIGFPVSTAELITSRKDIHYGNYRASIQYTNRPGTCGSMFWVSEGGTITLPRSSPYLNLVGLEDQGPGLMLTQYQNEKQEIDAELLSYQEPRRRFQTPITSLLHGEVQSGKAEHQVSFHPSDGYNEFRFDWSSCKVSFYTDGEHVKDLTGGVPESPGRIVLNHWSNGEPNWTKDPPVTDAYMTVAYVKAYFNQTSGRSQNRGQCDTVCEVPNQIGPLKPGQDTVFLAAANSNHQHDLSSSPNGNTSTASSTDSHDSAPTSNTSATHVSPDATCGGAQSYTCLVSEMGSCCSVNGWWYVHDDP